MNAMVSLTDRNRDDLAMSKSIVLALTAVIIATVNFIDVGRGMCGVTRGNKEGWLIISSQIFVVLGAVSYYIGDNLPELLSEFPEELNCDEQCQERGLIAGIYFLFVALTAFTFLPEIFRKANKVVNEEYDEHKYMTSEPFKRYHVQYFVIRMLALTLDFDAVYTGVWVYAFVDVENCDTNDIVGSSFCIATGWVTWSVYAFTFGYYLTNVRIIIKNIRYCKLLETEYKVLNGFFYAAFILFFFTFFPVHILSDNEEPLSCGCASSENASMTVFACEERPGVMETRVTFFTYQLVLLGALAILGGVKGHLKETKNN